MAYKVSLILLARSISKSIHLNNGNIDGDMEVELSGPDLISVKNIDQLLSSILKNHRSDFIQDNIKNITIAFSIPEIWNSISILAEAILAIGDLKLTRQEIEDVLLRTYYFEHIKKYI